MARITSYSTLVSAIEDRMNDTALDSYVDEFIQMAEAMFNRRLNCIDMEGTATIASDNDLPLPTDYKGSMTIRIGNDKAPLKQLGPDDFQEKWRDTTGEPENFAIFGGIIHLGPDPGSTSYTVTMTYLRTLTALSSTNTSNWLLEQHPDLYLYGSLLHAEFRGWNDERLPLINSAVEQMIAEINVHDARKRRGNLIDTVSSDYF